MPIIENDSEYTLSKIFAAEFSDYNLNKSKFLNDQNRVSSNQIIIIESGSAEVWVDINHFYAKPNSIFLFSEGQIQKFENINDLKGMVILFSKSYVNGGISLKDNNFDKDYFFDFAKLSKLKFSHSVIIEIIKYSKELCCKPGEKVNKIQQSISENFLNILLLKIIEQYKQQKQNEIFYSADVKIISEFNTLLNSSFNIEKNVSFYSNRLFINVKRLNEVTKRYYNKTAKQLIEDRILIETKRHLIHTNFSVKEISYKVGFSDPTNFNKFFKKFTRQTPLEFRISNQ